MRPILFNDVIPRWSGHCAPAPHGCGRKREVESRPTHGMRPLCDECARRPPVKPSVSGLDTPRTPKKKAKRAEPATTTAAADTPAIEQLEALFDLPTLGLSIVTVDIYGSGSRAAAEILVSNGETMTFDQLREMANPNILAAELVACTGATPKLTKPVAVKSIALARAIARTHRTMTDNDAAREWGATYLQGATLIDFDLDDQRDRWGAFSQLNEVEPNRDPIGVPPPNIVLRHADGSRLVRASWFGDFVRRMDTVSSREIPTRMSRVGWHRRGSEGRIKATRPGFRDALQWSFYIVAEGWEDDTAVEPAVEPAGNEVTASGLVNARTQPEEQTDALSRVESVTDRYPVTTAGAAA